MKLNLLAETNESSSKASEEESDEGLGDEISLEDKSKRSDQIEKSKSCF